MDARNIYRKKLLHIITKAIIMKNGKRRRSNPSSPGRFDSIDSIEIEINKKDDFMKIVAQNKG